MTIFLKRRQTLFGFSITHTREYAIFLFGSALVYMQSFVCVCSLWSPNHYACKLTHFAFQLVGSNNNHSSNGNNNNSNAQHQRRCQPMQQTGEKCKVEQMSQFITSYKRRINSQLDHIRCNSESQPAKNVFVWFAEAAAHFIFILWTSSRRCMLFSHLSIYLSNIWYASLVCFGHLTVAAATAANDSSISHEIWL